MILDILLVDENGDETLSEDAGVFGKYASGALRVGQRIVFELLSNEDFVDSILNARTSYDTQVALTFHSQQALARVHTEDAKAGYSGEDAIKSIWFTSMTYEETQVTLTAQVTTQAGTLSVVDVPVSFTYRPSDSND